MATARATSERPLSGKFQVARRLIARPGPRRFEAIKHCLSRYTSRRLVDAAMTDALGRLGLVAEALGPEDIQRVLDDAMFGLRWVIDDTIAKDLERDLGKVMQE